MCLAISFFSTLQILTNPTRSLTFDSNYGLDLPEYTRLIVSVINFKKKFVILLNRLVCVVSMKDVDLTKSDLSQTVLLEVPFMQAILIFLISSYIVIRICDLLFEVIQDCWWLYWECSSDIELLLMFLLLF